MPQLTMAQPTHDHEISDYKTKTLEYGSIHGSRAINDNTISIAVESLIQ
jgi:hypothetical protein